MQNSPFPFTIVPASEDEFFMLEALKEAWKAFQNDEVPVGAVIVHEGKVVARAHNQMELLQDATAHAEMLCITAAEAACSNWRLNAFTLYSTLEPCTMCAGALLLTRVSTLVWGAPDIRHGANGSWINLFKEPHPTHSPSIRRGILEECSAHLMRTFFQNRREKDEKQFGVESY